MSVSEPPRRPPRPKAMLFMMVLILILLIYIIYLLKTQSINNQIYVSKPSSGSDGTGLKADTLILFSADSTAGNPPRRRIQYYIKVDSTAGNPPAIDTSPSR